MGDVLWRVAWNGKLVALAAFLAFDVAGVVVDPFVGLVLVFALAAGFAWAVFRTRPAVEPEAKRLLADAEARARTTANLGPSASSYLLTMPVDHSSILGGARQYRTAVITLGEATMVVREGGWVDLSKRRVVDGHIVRVFQLAHVASAETTINRLVISFLNGHQLTYLATAGIQEVANALCASAQRMRALAAAPPSVATIERQVIERQVVVTRCKFCRELTPVDLSECKHCGSPMGGL